MTYLVAFDDTPLSRGALRKAAEYAEATDSELVAVAVVPKANVAYYREKGWVDHARRTTPAASMGEATADAVVEVLRARVERIAPEAGFEAAVTDLPGSLTRGVADELRHAIADHEAGDVFVGARDPGRLVSVLIDPLDPKYHLHMIRRPYITGSRLARFS